MSCQFKHFTNNRRVKAFYTVLLVTLFEKFTQFTNMNGRSKAKKI